MVLARTNKKTTNRLRRDIQAERAARAVKLKKALAAIFQLALIAGVVYLAFPFLALLNFSAQSEKDIAAVKKNETDIKYNFINRLPKERINSPPPEFSRAVAVRPPPQKTKKFIIQAASFKSRKRAAKMKSRMEKSGFNNIKIDKITTQDVTWFRIRIGSYPHIKAAQRARAKLTAKGFGDCVIKPLKKP